MTDTSALRTFIEARLAEDQAAIDKASRFPYLHPTDAPWERSRIAVARGAALSSDPLIALHSPAREAREVAAKRAIIADLDRARAQAHQHPKDHASTGWMLGMMRALGFLSLAWSDHPDFDPSWTSWSTT